jgi:hypothetical protein
MFQYLAIKRRERTMTWRTSLGKQNRHLTARLCGKYPEQRIPLKNRQILDQPFTGKWISRYYGFYFMPRRGKDDQDGLKRVASRQKTKKISILPND